MKNLFIICCFLGNLLLLGACSDVESMGDPQPRKPRVEVESDAYYVQITRENLEGVAFVYRWLDMEDAAKYAMTLSAESTEETIDVQSQSILTYSGVREQQFTNRQVMEYLRTFGLLTSNSQSSFKITLEAFNADGASITSEVAKASKTSAIYVIIAPDVNLTTN